MLTAPLCAGSGATDMQAHDVKALLVSFFSSISCSSGIRPAIVVRSSDVMSLHSPALTLMDLGVA